MLWKHSREKYYTAITDEQIFASETQICPHISVNIDAKNAVWYKSNLSVDDMERSKIKSFISVLPLELIYSL